MSKPLAVDVELKKAFADLQTKAIETSQQIRFADYQIDNFTKQKMIWDLTEHEITNLNQEIRTFESVGRMFVLTPKNDIVKNLHERKKLADEKIAKYTGNKEYLERNLKDEENNLREMIQQIQKKKDTK